MKDQKLKSLNVSDETGNAFIAIADLLNMDKNELLEELMTSYIGSVRGDMIERTSHHPQFVSKHPFIQ